MSGVFRVRCDVDDSAIVVDVSVVGHPVQELLGLRATPTGSKPKTFRYEPDLAWFREQLKPAVPRKSRTHDDGDGGTDSVSSLGGEAHALSGSAAGVRLLVGCLSASIGFWVVCDRGHDIVTVVACLLSFTVVLVASCCCGSIMSCSCTL